MEESTLVKTFEMLVERLGKIEDQQAEILQGMREAAEATGSSWLPGRIHCGFPVQIHKSEQMDLPLTSGRDFVSVRFEFKEPRDNGSLDETIYWDWLFYGKPVLDPSVFHEDLRAALTRVRQQQMDMDAADPEGDVYDPRCEELGLLHRQPWCKMFISEYVCREIVQRSCSDCEVIFTLMSENVVALRFPDASPRKPVGLVEIMGALAQVLQAHGKGLQDVKSVHLATARANLALLYLLLLNNFGDREAAAYDEFKVLLWSQQLGVCGSAKDPGDLFHAWAEKLQRWIDEAPVV